MRRRKKNISTQDALTLMEINSFCITELTNTLAVFTVVYMAAIFWLGLVMLFVACLMLLVTWSKM